MKTIIAGSRSITDYKQIVAIINSVDSTYWDITEVVCGMARGVDLAGKKWAEENNIPVTMMPAPWNDLTAPGAIIKTNIRGEKYNARAGHIRNEAMAQWADALLLIWDGISPGSKNMLDLAKKYDLKFAIYSFRDKIFTEFKK